MGLLTTGHPLTWEETNKEKNKVKEKGLKQFIHTFHKLKDRKTPCLMWGDEIEYMIVSFDDQIPKAKVLLKGEKFIEELNENGDPDFVWNPEFASYMVEGTPGSPYKGNMAYYNIVELNMKNRRDAIRSLLLPNETVLTIPSFPRLGCEDFCDPITRTSPGSGIMQSLYVPDRCANNSHPRFLTLAGNIKARKGRKVYINIPIYQDVNTPKPFKEKFDHLGPPEVVNESMEVSIPNHIYMDCMCFGMGCCCLQVTFQACNIEEARYLYDQLGALCPIMLALTAASPIFKGYLSDRDCRWDVISGSVDDRTQQELGIQPPVQSNNQIPKSSPLNFGGNLRKPRSNSFESANTNPPPIIRKSRYDSIDCYISYAGKAYNDIPLVYDSTHLAMLLEAGVDELLAQHIAHLFIRDPVLLFAEKLEQTDQEIDHFENIQSTNWQTMRFKPPPPNTDIGWRVEFRPQEIQLTDFENAAYVIFIVLLTRVILSYNLNFLIPISKMETNMCEAQKRDAVLNGKFFFHYKNFAKNMDVIQCEECAIKQEEKNYNDSRRSSADTSQAITQNNKDSSSASPPQTIQKTFPHNTSSPNGSVPPLENGFNLPLTDLKTPSPPAGQLQKSENKVLSCSSDSGCAARNCASCFSPASPSDWKLMSCDEIINGNREFPGLVPLVKNYINNMEMDVTTRCNIHQYLKLIQKRATGEIPTMARFTRDFVMRHPDYRKDSKVSDLINYDFLRLCDKMTKGQISCPFLLGANEFQIPTLESIQSSIKHHERRSSKEQQTADLLLHTNITTPSSESVNVQSP